MEEVNGKMILLQVFDTTVAKGSKISSIIKTDWPKFYRMGE
jgi:hypothetical protein